LKLSENCTAVQENVIVCQPESSASVTQETIKEVVKTVVQEEERMLAEWNNPDHA
jgi:hypothetical protein